MSTALLPVLILVVILAADASVYFDAKAQEQQGTPVVCSLGPCVVDTPGTWFICCLILFVVFVPLYVAGRAR